jgi:hemin uptake protein HemP
MRIVLIWLRDKMPVDARESGGSGGRESEEASAPLRTTSRELLKDRGELVIVHQGREYHLRVTQNGKLILTA